MANSKIITDEYIVFELDQVLTKYHLNQLFNYLDKQERLTRNKLFGMGIACGLNITCNESSISISKGCGITSQGYLILNNPPDEDRTDYQYLTEYRSVPLPADLPFNYNPEYFYKNFPFNHPIYELLTEQQKTDLNDPSRIISTISKPGILLSDFLVVLFLEAFEKDLKNCTTFDCDNKGEKMIFTLRPLLVHKNDLPPVTLIQSHAKAPEINLGRYNVPFKTLNTTDDVLNAFTGITNDFTLQRIDSVYNFCYDNYKSILNEPNSPFTDLFITLRNKRNEILNYNPVEIEYFYDFINDLYNSYLDFRHQASKIGSTCCGDEDLFPLHLTLGEATGNTDQIAFNPDRQYFIYASFLEHQKQEQAELRLIFQRMKAMISSFNVPSGNIPTRITPSRYESVPLSDRAIPYYYKINKNDSDIYHFWSFGRTAKGNAAFNLSYNAELYNSDDAVRNPLYYDIENHNFFRIEGHIGKNHADVLKDLLEKRQTFNLPFDLVAVSAELLSTNVTKLPECNLLDLETDYKLIITDFICRLHLPFCYMTKIPMVTLDQATLTKTFTNASMNQFSSFKKEVNFKDLKTPEFRQKKHVKGGFMKKYCPPEKDTVGQYYLDNPDIQDLISSITPANKTKEDSTATFYLRFYEAIFYFIDAVEDLMAYLMNSSIAILDMTIFKTKYLAYINKVNGLGLLIIIWLELLAKQNKKSTAANDLLLDLGLNALSLEFNSMLSSCTDDRLQTLKAEHLHRLSVYEDLRRFLTYYRKHPGLEHKGGVPKGGTFVLVYHTNENNSLKINVTAETKLDTKEEAIPAISLSSKIAENVKKIGITELETIRTFIDECSGASQANKRKVIGIIDTIDPTRTFRKYSIPDGAVIADFYLPYLCCSECPPVAFIYDNPPSPDVNPTIEVAPSKSTSDPKDFCPEDSNQYKITGTPENGTFSGDGVTKGFFMPKGLPAGPHVIKYSILGHEATVTVTIEAAAVADFNYNQQVKEFRHNDPEKNLSINFLNTSLNAKVFKWDFSDGASSMDTGTTIIHSYEPAFIHKYKGSFKVSLTAGNGICKDSQKQEEILLWLDVYLENKVNDVFCNNDKTNYHIRTNVPGGTLTLDDLKPEGFLPKLENQKSNVTTLAPSNLKPGKHQLKYSFKGLTAIYDFLVESAPDLKFHNKVIQYAEEELSVEFTNDAMVPKVIYSWDFGDNQNTKTAEQTVSNRYSWKTIVKKQGLFTVALKPESYPCQSLVKQNILLFPLNKNTFKSSDGSVRIYASSKCRIEVQPAGCQQSVKQATNGTWSFNPSYVPFMENELVTTIQMKCILNDLNSNTVNVKIIKSPSGDFTNATKVK
ncbi:MAG: hypothetical protein NTX61_05530 [Bacteroidetes bacterium]|nr:hypothetical protein [Bacteroidota bacterium]